MTRNPRWTQSRIDNRNQGGIPGLTKRQEKSFRKAVAKSRAKQAKKGR